MPWVSCRIGRTKKEYHRRYDRYAYSTDDQHWESGPTESRSGAEEADQSVGVTEFVR